MKLQHLKQTINEIQNWEFDCIPIPVQPAILATAIDGFCFFGDERQEDFNTYKLFSIRDIENFAPNFSLIANYCQEVFDIKAERSSIENETKNELLTNDITNCDIELF